MDFQARAKLADAAVWGALASQVGTLTEAKDIEAVMAGATAALTRLVWATTADPTVNQTVEVIREMTCRAVVEVQKQAEALT